MPIRRYSRYPDHDPRGWPEVYRDPPTKPIPRPPQFDVPDPDTPLFDAVWALSGLSGRHVLNPDRRVMGRHTDADGSGAADHAERTFTHPDGTTYQRVSASEIENCDLVDSTTIVDDGAPD